MNQDFALQNNDLLIVNGDFAIAESDSQHIADTLNAFPGWFKEFPQDGIGVFDYYNSSGREQVLKRNIQIQLQADGYKVKDPQVKINAAGQMTINPNATPNENL
jgi:hypothetical protein